MRRGCLAGCFRAGCSSPKPALCGVRGSRTGAWRVSMCESVFSFRHDDAGSRMASSGGRSDAPCKWTKRTSSTGSSSRFRHMSTTLLQLPPPVFSIACCCWSSWSAASASPWVPHWEKMTLKGAAKTLAREANPPLIRAPGCVPPGPRRGARQHRVRRRWFAPGDGEGNGATIYRVGWENQTSSIRAAVCP